MSLFFTHKAEKLSDGFKEADDKRFQAVSPADVPQELFEKSDFDQGSVEKTGYSNYSYWRSTLQVFLKNRAALFFLCLLVVLLAFTFIQPLLPFQKSPTKIYNYDDTHKPIGNKAPYFSNALSEVPAGEGLLLEAEGKTWATVANGLSKTARNEKLLALSEEGAFTLVQNEEGVEGYVASNALRFDLSQGDEQKPYPKTGRMFMAGEITRYPAKEIYVSMQDIEIAAHEAYDKTFAATVTKQTPLRITPTSLSFWFGTNAIGQDLWSRIWAGTRTSLFIGVSVGLLCAVIGILVGALWGYVRKLDKLFTEIYNVLENIPATVIRMLITYIMRPSLSTIIFVMCLTGWMGMARFVRNQIVIIRDREYNLASRSLGTGTFQMILRNMLPYLVSVIMLRTAMAIPEAIGTEVFLTYIGLGLPVTMPSLGNLLNEGRIVMTDAALSYQLIFPAVVVSLITMSFYALGNAFADAADPRNHI